MRRHYYGLVHVIFMAVALVMVPRHARAQRRDSGYLVEKLQEQERHLDNSDAISRRVEDRVESLQSRMDRDEGIFIGADGLLGVLLAVGAIKRFNQGKESNG